MMANLSITFDQKFMTNLNIQESQQGILLFFKQLRCFMFMLFFTLQPKQMFLKLFYKK